MEGDSERTELAEKGKGERERDTHRDREAGRENRRTDTENGYQK